MSHNKLKRYELESSFDSGALTNEVVGRFKGPGVTGGEHKITFQRKVMAEYLTVQMEGKGILHVNKITIEEAGNWNVIDENHALWKATFSHF